MPFSKGQGGRPKGAKNAVPHAVKTSLMSIYERLQHERPELFIDGIIKGLELNPPQNFPYLRMWAEYSEGKPVERHEHSGPQGGPIAYKWQD